MKQEITRPSESKGIDPGLLEILICPLCKVSVRDERMQLVCDRCNRRYPIRDGIPVMLLEEAEQPSRKAMDG